MLIGLKPFLTEGATDEQRLDAAYIIKRSLGSYGVVLDDFQKLREYENAHGFVEIPDGNPLLTFANPMIQDNAYQILDLALALSSAETHPDVLAVLRNPRYAPRFY